MTEGIEYKKGHRYKGMKLDFIDRIWARDHHLFNFTKIKKVIKSVILNVFFEKKLWLSNCHKLYIM